MAIVFSVGIIAGIFCLDLWIKNYIEANGKEGQSIEKLGGKLIIRKYHNKGAALNIGEKKSQLVAAISLILCIGLTILFILSFGKIGSKLFRLGMSLLLGGAFSNVYDRLKRKYVVDYVSFGTKWKRFNRIIFNVSDFCIMIGATLVVISMK